ncbi:hypothetical protein OA074_00435 [bacterium]|nr:hypothetical protein [bacterium]
MKKLLAIVVLGFVLVSCISRDERREPLEQLGDFNQFFKLKKNIYGGTNVKIITSNPASITFVYDSDEIKYSAVAKAAQFHCEKYKKNSMEKLKETHEDSAFRYKIVFECK